MGRATDLNIDTARPGGHSNTSITSWNDARPQLGANEGAEKMKVLLVAGAVFLALGGAASAQDVAAGENSFKKCLPCHSVGEDAKNKVGPVLNGLDGRKAGT